MNTTSSNYQKLQSRLGSGWNTWNTFSVFSHVLLPESVAVNLTFRDETHRKMLRAGYIGHYAHSVGPDSDLCLPGPRSYDGRYTQLDVTWSNLKLVVESATDGDDLVLLITPRPGCPVGLVAAEGAILWGREGTIGRQGAELVLVAGGRTVRVFATGPLVDEPYMRADTPYVGMALEGPVGFSSGRPRTLSEIQTAVDRRRREVEADHARYGAQQELYTAMQTCLAWNTIYDPEKQRVVSPVSRVWNLGWGSYVLFCWDNFFAGLMAGIDNRELAYANVVEILREKTPVGFVPNFAAYPNRKSFDRSQPPVGSMVAWRLFERWGDKWFLEEIYQDLLTWNRWWDAKRCVAGRWLAWGSNRVESWQGQRHEHTRKAAILESGLDNSPMYDDATYDDVAERLNLADVGLTGMYIGDCRALASIAAVLDRSEDVAELRARADRYAAGCAELWDDASGIYLNRHTDTRAPSSRLSPTNFYALIGRVASPEQARRMVDEHLLNPGEFWGDWVLPSCSRSDPAFAEQRYWRGPVWGPMNMLVYMGMQEYDLVQARHDLAAKSAQLLLKEWREHRHVHENYNSTTGEGCSSRQSNPFYHWGGLLALPALMEAGHYGPPGRRDR